MRVGEIFCIPFSFLLLPLGACYILPICFGLAFALPFFFIYVSFYAFICQKKKKELSTVSHVSSNLGLHL